MLLPLILHAIKPALILFFFRSFIVNGVVDVAQGVGTIVNRLANSTTTNNAVAPAGNANRDVEFVTVGNRPNESAFLRRIEENF